MAKPTLSSVELNLGYTAWSSSYVDTELHNNFYTIRPTLDYLRSNKEELSGGHEWRVPVLDAIEPVGGSYKRADTFSWTDVDPGMMAIYYQVQYDEPCVVLAVDEDRYEGMAAVLPFVKTKLDNTTERLARKINLALYSASADTTKDVNSLVDVVASSGTIGNISATTSTFWASTVSSSFSFASSGASKLRSMWTALTKYSNVGEPDIILCDATVNEAAKSAGFAHMTVMGKTGATADNSVSLSTSKVGYEKALFVYDPDCTSGAAYVLNKKAIALVERAGQGLTTDPWIDLRPAGIRGRGTKANWKGQLVAKSRAGLGKFTSVTA